MVINLHHIIMASPLKNGIGLKILPQTRKFIEEVAAHVDYPISRVIEGLILGSDSLEEAAVVFHRGNLRYEEYRGGEKALKKKAIEALANLSHEQLQEIIAKGTKVNDPA